MFPDASETALNGNEPQHAMYHRSTIIFTPLGQLDGLGVVSKKFKGIMIAELEPTSVLTKAGLKKFDIITGINGKALSAVPTDAMERLTPAVELSEALMQLERKGGVMSIRYERGPLDAKKRPRGTKVRIKPLGSFTSYLKTGKFTGRSQRVSEQALDTLLKTQKENGSWSCSYGSQLSTSLAGIHLIMLADRFPKRRAEIIKSLDKVVEYLSIAHPQWLWDMGMTSWFLAEYFWATGDMTTYDSLHKSIVNVDNGINPLGGVCHKPLCAPYGNVNMGGPYGMVSIAMKAMEPCRAAFNRKTTSELMDLHVLGFKNSYDYNASGYGGNLHKGTRIGESGFTTASYITAWHRYKPTKKSKVTVIPKRFAKEKQNIVANMHSFLQDQHAAISNIHATPAFGTIFTSLAFSTFALNSKEALENSLMKNRLEQLVLGMNSKGEFKYVYPRSARMALPGGGGWNGDGIMGKEHLTTLIAISFLNSANKNLLVNAPPRARSFCWLSKESPKKAWSQVVQFHRKGMIAMADEIKSAYKNKEREKCLNLIDSFHQTYPNSSFKNIYPNDVKKLLAIIGSKVRRGKIDPLNTRKKEVADFLKKVYSDNYKATKYWEEFMEKVFKLETQQSYKQKK